MLYIIPYRSVARIVTLMPPHMRANPACPEYRIDSLPRDCFDLVERF
jgi:hypothetical protein